MEKSAQTKYIGITVSVVLLSVLIYFIRLLIVSPNSVEKLVESAGFWGPIILIILMTFGILFSPIPSFLFIIISGYLYGFWLGSLFSYIGHFLAAFSMFLGYRNFRKFFGKSKRSEKYKRFIKEHSNLLYFFFMVPIVPISLLSIVSASSRIKTSSYAKVLLISFIIPVFFFSFFGQRLSFRNLLEITILVFIIVLVFIVAYKLGKKREEKKKRSFGF
jgi:uncharacterized membrane protein YdjX (TVP38/TMEM64 family)